MLEHKDLTNFDEIRAYSDPYRIRILNEFFSLNKPATSKQIADIIGDVPAKVYYHVKKLEKYGIIALHHTEQVNGIIAKFYEPVAKEYILHNDNISNIPFNTIKSDVENLIHNMYKGSEDIFMLEMKKHVENNEDKAKVSFDNTTDIGKGWVHSSDEIYLTEEEANEFCKFISDFTQNHKNDNPDNKKKYHIFISSIQHK